MGISGILLLICWLSATNAQTDTQKQDSKNHYVPLNYPVSGQSSRDEQNLTNYLFHLDKIEEKYLFFDVNPRESSLLVGITTYITLMPNVQPTLKCSLDSIGTCYLSWRNLKANQVISVNIICDRSCQYTLIGSWVGIQSLKDGYQKTIAFGIQHFTIHKALYSLDIGQQPKMQQLRVIMKPNGKKTVTDFVKLYGSYGANSTPSADSYDFKSISLWQNAQGIFLRRQDFKSNQIIILMKGQALSNYTLSCELINNTHHDLTLQETIYEVVQKGEHPVYHINFTSEEETSFYDQFVIKFSVFSGNATIKCYTDEKIQSELLGISQKFKGDSEIVLNKDIVLDPNDQETIKNLYVQINGEDFQSTYMLHYSQRNASKMLELQEHIFESVFLEHNSSRSFYFNVSDQFSGFMKSVYSIWLTDYNIQVNMFIYQCDSINFEACLNNQYQKLGKMIKPTITNIAGSKIHRVEVSHQGHQDNQNVSMVGTLFIKLYNPNQNDYALTGLQFFSESEAEYLREGSTIVTTMKSEERREYIFQNNDPNVEEVRILLNTISGTVRVASFRKKDTQMEADGINIETTNMMVFTENLTTLAILVQVFALENSIFSLSLQTVHANSYGASTIEPVEEVWMKIRIGSQKFQLFQIELRGVANFRYKSTGQVLYCVYNNNNTCYNNQLTVLLRQGQFAISTEYGDTGKLLFRNPSIQEAIDLSLYYSVPKQNTSLPCELLQFNKLYSETIILNKNNCFKFKLSNLNDGIQVLVKSVDLDRYQMAYILCKKKIEVVRERDGNAEIISQDSVAKNCQNEEEPELLLIQQAPTDTIHLNFVVQYVSSPSVLLPDGVGYHLKTITKQQNLKAFVYQMVNIANTAVFLTEKLGSLQFFINVIDYSENEMIPQLIRTDPSDYKSPNSMFFASPFLIITKQQLEKFPCAIVARCSLLIRVYSKENIGEEVEFILQVTQKERVLGRREIVSNYLRAGEMAYYSYVSHSTGSLLVETSDNNVDCTKIYISTREFPNQDSYEAKEIGHELYIPEATQATYYIGVEAIKNCGFSITVASGISFNLTKVERGKTANMMLQKDEVKYFLFKHLSKRRFKLLSLHKFGRVSFYLNRTSEMQLSWLLDSNIGLNYSKFQMQSPQPNRLVMNPEDKFFCSDCYYLLAAKAAKETESSLFLGDDGTQIPIVQKKVINDWLSKKGDTMVGVYYSFGISKAYVKVHSGVLSIVCEQNAEIITKQYNPSNQIFEFGLQFTNAVGFSMDKIKITFKALADDTLYSFEIKIVEQETEWSKKNLKNQVTVSAGQPSFMFINTNKMNLAIGYLREARQKILITTQRENREMLRNITIQLRIEGKITQFTRTLVSNILTIEPDEKAISSAMAYELYIKTEDSFGATLMQTEDVQLVAPDTQVMANFADTFVLHPHKNFLLDVYECSGQASVAYSHSQEGLDKATSNSLETIGMPQQQHAIKIAQSSTIFLQIKSELALFRWLPMDINEQKGIGYLLYSAGDLHYNPGFNKIEIIWQGIKRTKQTKTIVKSITYTLYISNTIQHLKSATQCEKYLQSDVTAITLGNYGSNSLGLTISKELTKTQILTKFQDSEKLENLYVNVVADVSIQVPSLDNEQNHQHYRFIYQRQEIPSEVFRPSSIETYNILLIILAIILAIVAILVFSFLCIRKVIPMLSRLRTRSMVEEEPEDDRKSKQQYAMAPITSDRRGIQTDQKGQILEPVESQQKMQSD